jgi:hypothetical protein
VPLPESVGKGPEFAIQSRPKNKKPFHKKRWPTKKEWLMTNYELGGWGSEGSLEATSY